MTDSTDTAESTDLEPAIQPVTDEQANQPTPSQETNEEAATTTAPPASDSKTTATDNDPSDDPEHPADSVPDGIPQRFDSAIEAGQLKQLIKTVRAVTDECRFRLDEDTLYIRAMDPANVAMADIAVDADAFETYNSSGGTIGLNLKRLAEVLELAQKGDLIQLDLDTETRKLTLTIDAMDMTLALIDPQAIRPEPGVPELDLPMVVTITAADLARAIKAGQMVADHLHVSVDPSAGCLRAEATGDTDDVSLELDRADCVAFDTAITDPVTSMYSLDYLDGLATPLPADAEITLELGDEFPLAMTFRAAEDTIDGRFLVAPRRTSD